MRKKVGKKHFYSHIVEVDSLVFQLDQMGFTQEEKTHLISLVDSSLHHVVLDVVLSELSENDKQIFLKKLASEDHDAVWELLNNKIEHIEEKIKKAADELKEELHRDIKEAKENNP